MLTGGAQAEQAAAAYLVKRGLQLVEKNYRCRFGEIDLIMRAGVTLVFVEVRSRSSRAFGGAAASIDARKQRKLIAAAQHYLAQLGNRRHADSTHCCLKAAKLNGYKMPSVRSAWRVS